MKQILPHFLWLGHAGDGTDARQLFAVGIEALVQLAMEVPPVQPPRELIYCRIPLVDGSGNSTKLLRLAIRTVAELLSAHVPTLVCCNAGLSRAPAIAAAALSLLSRQSPGDCLRRLAEEHPCDVAPALWDDIVQVLGSLSG
jgi:hypothetical protein